ncbi:excalibur calcium-binding domain-containing protein [Rathayibacter rathayi]|uniref:excalibur calcium-binding domain-containing protein n=1 Tax=Rathayibacter rathayi TaxID=33887 RepID=UPI001C68153D|nr:excalibur calcium-binding domain-containing protein [Rathayibacter rathayi]
MTDPSPSTTVWSPLPPAKEKMRKRDRQHRRVPLVALVGASVGALLVGTAIGGASGGASGASNTTELKGQLAAAQQQLSSAEDSLEEQTNALAEVDAKRSAAETSAAGLQQKVDAMTAEAATSTTTLASRDARIAELESAAESAAVAPAAAAPAAAAPAAVPNGGGSVSYANCDAVHAAGAAPIRTDDPGYSRKLDRDGDGVACE